MQNRPFNKTPSSSLRRNLMLVILSCKCCPCTRCWQRLAVSHRFPWTPAKASRKLLNDPRQTSDKYHKAEIPWFYLQFHGCEPEVIWRKVVFSVASKTVQTDLLPGIRGPSSSPSLICPLSYHPCNHLFSKLVIDSLGRLFSYGSCFMTSYVFYF